MNRLEFCRVSMYSYTMETITSSTEIIFFKHTFNATVSRDFSFIDSVMNGCFLSMSLPCTVTLSHIFSLGPKFHIGFDAISLRALRIKESELINVFVFQQESIFELLINC
jgi:hypothetical protein